MTKDRVGEGVTVALRHAPSGEERAPIRHLPKVERVDYLSHLRGSNVDRATIDLFLDPGRPSWAAFDPVSGYRLADFTPHDGIDGSMTISTVGPTSARRQYAYTTLPCRINTYGDSFTQCQQVSDGETWQEYLASHLAEPIRNFGVGGYGLYQAFRRMVREEQTAHGATNVVLYIYGDDHIRSLFRCRHATIYPWFDNSGTNFHCNFWSNIELDPSSGDLREQENLLAAPEDVYRMSDADWMVQALQDDLACRMALFVYGRIGDLDFEAVARVAESLGERIPARRRMSRDVVQRLLDAYSFAATRYILRAARTFLEHQGKKLFVVTFDPHRALPQLIAGQPRYDQEIVDFLADEAFEHFDMNMVHVHDYAQFRVPFDRYLERFFIGHYSPAGNHFFAQSIRRHFVGWLDPRPIPYATDERVHLDFSGYLRPHRTDASATRPI
jgi:hypothetical protein